jgi:hypothetical protein
LVDPKPGKLSISRKSKTEREKEGGRERERERVLSATKKSVHTAEKI